MWYNGLEIQRGRAIAACLFICAEIHKIYHIEGSVIMRKLLKYLTILCIVLVSLATTIFATEQPQEIKVGYVSNYGTVKAGFTQGSEGYGYEYLTNLLGYMEGDYTLTFVDCTNFQDCLDKLDSGEIDIVGPTMQYEGLDYIYTADDFGNCTIMLATLATDLTDVSFDGTTIGVPDYYIDYTCLTEFMETEGFEAEIVKIPSSNLNITVGMQDIDFLYMTSIQSHSGFSVVTGLESQPLYLMATADNQDLMDKLDRAHDALEAAEPYFQDQLTLEYSSYNFTNNAYISESSLALVQEKGTYRVGIRNFYSPLIREGEDGELEGVAFVLLDMLGEEAGVDFEYVLLEDDATQADFDSVDFMITATNSTTELGFPNVSSPYLDLPFILLEHQESATSEGESQSIGVASYYRTDSLMVDDTLYGREVVKYKTVQELQQAFDANEIDCMLITVVSLNMIRDDFETQDYVATTVEDTLQLCLAFSADMSTAEMTVFNKIISTLDQATLEAATLEYAITNQETTLGGLVTENPWLMFNFIIILVLVGAVVAGIAEYRRRILWTKNMNTDGLTGLLSQHKFNQEAVRILKNYSPKQCSIVSIDIDNFKYINEMYGFDIGSRLLQITAEYIGQSISAEDLLARSFGDNFLIMTSVREYQTTLAQWEDLDNNFQLLVQEKLQLPCRINFSVGVYEITDTTLDINVMLDYANIARQMGKETTGFTYHYFTEKMAEVRLINNEITTAMVPAIQNEEFVLYYQPKLDLHSEAVVGAEVLVRWIGKEGILNPPNRFVPLFEKNGFIETLDYYVLRHTCMFLQKHSNLNIPRLSVNLSGISMLRPNIVQNILDIVASYHIEPSQLDLEITETAFVENSVVIEHMGELRCRGFTISMDDFGTGVSSLNRLKDMELDTLKIDRAFIIDSLENPRGGQILQSVVQMAKGLNLETVAEGIETEEQRDFLKNLGCDVGQGYLFARPLPEEDFIAYYKEHCTNKTE